MFRAITEIDDYGKEQRRYYLTQGDSVTFTVTPNIPIDQIEKLNFKISDFDFIEELVKEGQLSGGKFIVRLTSEETAKLPVDVHRYEFECILSGGAVQTPIQWKINITEQITKGE